MFLEVIGVIAELEYSIIGDRLQSGGARTGYIGGRKSVINEAQRKDIKRKLDSRDSIPPMAREYGTSRAAIHRESNLER